MTKISLIFAVAWAFLVSAAGDARAGTPIRVQVAAAGQAAATSQAQSRGNLPYLTNAGPGGGFHQAHSRGAASHGYYHTAGTSIYTFSAYGDYTYYTTSRFPADNPGMFSNPGIVVNPGTFYQAAP